jgi:hypothetical protein
MGQRRATSITAMAVRYENKRLPLREIADSTRRESAPAA